MATIGDSLARKKEQQPQFDYLFRVELPMFNSQGTDNNGIPQFIAPTHVLNHRVYSVDAPFIEYESKKSIDGSSFFYTASNSGIGTVSMRIDEMQDGLTLDYLLKWQSLIGDEHGRNPPALYKANIKVVRLSSLKADAHIHNYLGFFPTQISPTSFTHDGNGVLQYQVTFTGDDVKHTIIPASSIQNELGVGEFGGPGSIIDGVIDSMGPNAREIFDAIDRVAGGVAQGGGIGGSGGGFGGLGSSVGGTAGGFLSGFGGGGSSNNGHEPSTGGLGGTGRNIGGSGTDGGTGNFF